jgi:hypothetical protein
MPTAHKLVKKLAEVMLAVERVAKRGTNDFHGYDYATEADVAEAIRTELADRHVVLIPEVTSIEHIPLPRPGNKTPKFLTHIMGSFTFMDGETGEMIQRSFAGSGVDTDDKGLYKAMTGAEKYFLLKSFMIPTGDDPERDQLTQRDKTDVEAAAQLPGVGVDARGKRVTNVTSKSGTSSKGKPWTAYSVFFSDGTRAGTFDEKLAKLAKQAKESNAIVDAVVEKEGKYLNVTELNIVDEITGAILDNTPEPPSEDDIAF